MTESQWMERLNSKPGRQWVFEEREWAFKWFARVAPRIAARWFNCDRLNAYQRERVQDAISLAFLRAIDTFDPARGKRLYGWCSTILRQVLSAEQRKRDGRDASPAVSLDSLTEDGRELPEGETKNSPADITIEKEHFLCQFSKLEQQYQDILIAASSDRPQSELATELGISVETFRTRLFRAKQRLRILLDSEE